MVKAAKTETGALVESTYTYSRKPKPNWNRRSELYDRLVEEKASIINFAQEKTEGYQDIYATSGNDAVVELI